MHPLPLCFPREVSSLSAVPPIHAASQPAHRSRRVTSLLNAACSQLSKLAIRAPTSGPRMSLTTKPSGRRLVLKPPSPRPGEGLSVKDGLSPRFHRSSSSSSSVMELLSPLRAALGASKPLVPPSSSRLAQSPRMGSRDTHIDDVSSKQLLSLPAVTGLSPKSSSHSIQLPEQVAVECHSNPLRWTQFLSFDAVAVPSCELPPHRSSMSLPLECEVHAPLFGPRKPFDRGGRKLDGESRTLLSAGDTFSKGFGQLPSQQQQRPRRQSSLAPPRAHVMPTTQASRTCSDHPAGGLRSLPLPTMPVIEDIERHLCFTSETQRDRTFTPS